MEPIQVFLGDSQDVLKNIPDNSIDSVVTDPPYGISFMSKKWDYDVPKVELWREVLRVLKPGGHALVACGTRTQHRMAVNLEDAGFEIRDVVAWVYGSGFPKSYDISKSIDMQDARGTQSERRYKFTEWVRSQGVTSRQIDALTNTNMGGHYTTNASQPAIMTKEHFEKCRHLFKDIPNWVEEAINKRSVESNNLKSRLSFKEPYTSDAKKWDGWGSALKPSIELFTLCQKPLSEINIAENVLKWQTGGLNIDGCRVGEGREQGQSQGRSQGQSQVPNRDESRLNHYPITLGRFPANFIHDGSEEVTTLLGEAQRFFYCAKASKGERNRGLEGFVLGGLSLTISLIIGEKEIEIWNETLTTSEGGKVRQLEDMDKSLKKVIEEYGVQPKNGIGWNIISCGNSILEQSLMDTKFITKTGINSITTSQILNLLRHYNTRENTQAAKLSMENTGSRVVSVEKSKELTITIKGLMEYPLGARSVVLKMRYKINEKENRNIHSTVKPITLMRYLCRLITPKGGTVLDPFAGSGSTGIGAVMEGFNFIGVEREPEYQKIAQARIEAAIAEKGKPQQQGNLFDGEAG